MRNVFSIKLPDKRTIRMVFTTKDLAKLLGVKVSTINTWHKNGKLRFTGDSIRDLKMLLDFIKDNQNDYRPWELL